MKDATKLPKPTSTSLKSTLEEEHLRILQGMQSLVESPEENQAGPGPGYQPKKKTSTPLKSIGGETFSWLLKGMHNVHNVALQILPKKPTQPQQKGLTAEELNPSPTMSQKEKYPGYSEVRFVTNLTQEEASRIEDENAIRTLNKIHQEKLQNPPKK